LIQSWAIGFKWGTPRDEVRSPGNRPATPHKVWGLKVEKSQGGNVRRGSQEADRSVRSPVVYSPVPNANGGSPKTPSGGGGKIKKLNGEHPEGGKKKPVRQTQQRGGKNIKKQPHREEVALQPEEKSNEEGQCARPSAVFLGSEVLCQGRRSRRNRPGRV